MGASGIWSGRMLGVVAGILIVFGALSYGPTSHYTQRLRSSEQTTVTTGGGISSIFEFLQRPPSERRAGIFNAIKCAGNHTMEVFKPKPRTTPLPKPTPPPSPSPPSPVSLLNRPKQESVIVVNKHNPWVRFAVVAGMSGLFYKGIEHVVSNPVVHSYCKQHMPRLTQFYDKDILDKIRHLGACIRRSEGLSPLVDTLVGMRVPGTRKDGLKVHSITDQGTHLTTVCVGGG
uniref:Uncharacterized protein n=1 Tax=Amorphochlora amoebiformis TaxID=1561963 RepID=A0A6T6VBZ5_9EUKA|mmetsp:Transcript_25343/g.39999  ORF Transcript_25343/g.39999 Transcript_25343/m.39999 type:complete len:231 (+) Transcript_25343:30-722(+)